MRWRVLEKIKSKNPRERREEIIRALFINRGLKTKKQQEEFLKPKEPHKLTPREAGISSVQLIKAVKRIKLAIKKREKVIVYGDYDADGVCATAIMWETLHELGADVMPFIPTREEGYGLKVDRIDKMAKEGAKLIVTVDQGIVHSRQVSHARKAGIDVIITDHHQPGEKKPKAAAIIHSTKLAGAGVAWFLANYLLKHLKHLRGGVAPAAHLGGEKTLDLVTIGTVTDMVPLVGPNRSIVKHGLESLRKTKRLGLLALCQFAGVEKEKIGTYEVGYIIGPRINASGRMDDPIEALRLLCTRDENRAISLAQKIDQKNRERQELMKQTITHARDLWLEKDGKSPLIFVYHQSYEHGVVGLVASRLKDEFYRPAVVLAPRADHWVASARSIEEFSIIDAIREFGDILGDHGGHRLAAGFSVSQKRLEEVKQGLIKRAEKSLDKSKLAPKLKIEAEVTFTDLNLSLFQEVEKFAPFGIGNRRPVFASRGVKATDARLVGKENQHLKLRVACRFSPVTFDAIGFGMGEPYNQLEPEKPVDIAFELGIDEWDNQKKLQFKLKDLRIRKVGD